MTSAMSVWKVKWIVVAAEKHADGGDHLHIAVEFEAKFSTRDHSFANFICGSQGNYQAMKNMRKCLEYVIKDGDYCAHGIDPVAVVKKRTGSLSSWVASEIIGGRSIYSLMEDEPGFIMMNRKRIQDFDVWARRKRSLQLPGISEVINLSETLPAMRIADWIRQHLVAVNGVLPSMSFKARQMFIHGPPNLGKTSLVMNLMKHLRVYHIPSTEDFYDFYDDDDYDLAVLDEFGGQKPTYWLNEWLQGSPMTLRVKGGQYLKKKNIPTIILSNHPLERCYSKCNEEKLAPLRERLVTVEVYEFLSISFVSQENSS